MTKACEPRALGKFISLKNGKGYVFSKIHMEAGQWGKLKLSLGLASLCSYTATSVTITLQ